MKKLLINSNSIHDDLLTEILCRLPLESLYNFKWVSKSWFSIINKEILPKITQFPLMGFFYSVISFLPLDPLDVPPYIINTSDFFRYVEPYNNNNSAGIDPTLSFLPSCYQHLSIVDGCNGLALFSSTKSEGQATKRLLLVCNPATKSWTEVPRLDLCINKLVFDPRVSPHYRVVSQLKAHGERVFNIYYSETGRSKRLILEDCGSPSLSISCFVRNYAVFRGSLYMDCCHGITRLGWLEEDDIVPELIKLPQGAERAMSLYIYVGTSVDKLCFASTNGLRIMVWTLEGKCGNKWTMRHDCHLRGLGGYVGRNSPPVEVVGFHPSLLDEVFILHKGVIFMCNLKNMKVNEISRIGSESREVKQASLYLFSPCSAALLENQSES